MQHSVLTFILLLSVLPVHSTGAEPSLHLQLLPERCIVTVQQPRCQTRLKVVVSGEPAQSLCLQLEQSLWCQLHQPPAETWFELDINSDKSWPVTITSPQQQVLLQGILELQSFSEVKKRHKRGYLWNAL